MFYGAIYVPLNLYSEKIFLRDHPQIQIQFLTLPIRLDFLGKHILRVVLFHVKLVSTCLEALAQARESVSISTP